MPAIYKPRPRRASAVGLPRRHAVPTARSRRTSCRDALGWGIVPVTILRDDGPLGDRRRATLRRARSRRALLHVARRTTRTASASSRSFDVLVNNTDRKGGHCLHDVANDVDRRHRPRAHVPSDVEAAHRHLGLRGRSGPARARRRRVSHPRRARRRRARRAPVASAVTAGARGRRDPRRRSPARRRFPEPDPGYHSVPWPMV